MYRPQLQRQNANSTPRRHPSVQATIAGDKDKLIAELASSIYAMLKKLKKRSITNKMLKMLIANHLKLKSKSKAKKYMADLVRFKYMTETDHVYSFRMEAEILLSRSK
jgi:hypothetical protein